MPTLEEKIEQFNEFYLIPFNIKVNVLPCDKEPSSISMADFENSMPYAFKIAGEMAEIQSQTLKPLRNLGDKLNDLVDYLQFQAKKIDLMMSYILQQQDDPKYRQTAIKFGGGGVIVRQNNKVDLGETRVIKLFLESESAAIYCLAEAIVCEQINEEQTDISYVYTHIRERDQELLVRASLHLQTQTLRKQHTQ
ncbi:PilZ domain-containing protein [Glaciecola petra]|uniref:PilZ domain-containing protein n=1 Tax=Glaciecola petra TaxID=3075602 RepID=A0ABU2ZRE7_9ALTE|nr:PilZ domain-containing protein [Aestuariibacter sp. P117]MDT0594169.1 PilZ domain-containing protein [Aestuariibacter sp. P117]